MTRMGQYTGTSNASEKVQKTAMIVARVDESLCEAQTMRNEQEQQKAHQNCHSGSLRTKGLNSSSRADGSEVSSPPPSISSARRSSCREGSNFGCRNANRRFSR